MGSSAEILMRLKLSLSEQMKAIWWLKPMPEPPDQRPESINLEKLFYQFLKYYKI
jgi:hypothetical protein